MRIKIHPSAIKGTIEVPSSKSHFQRALAGALLCNGTSIINYNTISNDDQAVLTLIQSLGAKVQHTEKQLIIRGGLTTTSKELSCGESGLCLRMFSPILALLQQESTLHGHGSLLNRPQEFMKDPIQQLGGTFKSNHGLLPIQVSGPFKGGTAHIDGSFSSQFLSGLLMALPLAHNNSVIHVHKLTSKPYIDLTLQTLNSFGVTITHDNYKKFQVKGQQHYHESEIDIEGDWSAASNLIVAATINGFVQLNNLNSTSSQADRRIIEAIEYNFSESDKINNQLSIQKKPINAFHFDASNSPDLFPPLVALAINAKGTSTIKGVQRLAHKESDRGQALKQEFGKLGIAISMNEDTMQITGGPVKGGHVYAHKDHRIAMSLAVAALNAQAPVIIEGAECVAKSYPEFWNNLQALGVMLDRQE